MTVLTPPRPVYKPAPQKVWTLAEFYALPEGPPYYEFEDGELIKMGRPRIIHQKIMSKLDQLIGTYLDEHPIGDHYIEVNVQLSDTKVYVPDICFVGNDSEQALEGEIAIIGVPDLAVEILSPSTRNRDWNKKYIAYESHNVPFYWIIDPRDEMIWECKNTDNGYVRVQIVELNESFSPEIFPGLSFSLAQLMGKSPEKKEDNQNE